MFKSSDGLFKGVKFKRPGPTGAASSTRAEAISSWENDLSGSDGEVAEAIPSFVTRTCSYDESFEQVLPDHWQPVISIGEDVENTRGPPLDRERFEHFFDSEGRLVDEHGFRKAVFRGGIEEDVRKDAWKFLFGYFPCQSTKREREALELEFAFRYEALKARWKTILAHRGLTTGEDEQPTSHSDSSSCNGASSSPSTSSSSSSSIQRLCDDGDDEIQQKLGFARFQAKIYASRQPLDENDLDQIKKNLRIIDKDVPRTDRDLDFFRGQGNPNLEKLRNILVTFAVFHPTVTYAQGMNDVLSRFLVVMENETEAYWCFTLYLEKVVDDFLETGMIKKLESLKRLLEEIDEPLLKHLSQCDMGDLMFCHRWLLLCFKREFEFSQCLRIFEIISSDHLELCSLDAERERDKERAREFQKTDGVSRSAPGSISTEYTFELFVCVTILHEYRNQLRQCDDAASIFQMVNGLAQKLDLVDVLAKAESLLLSYCRKSVSSESTFALIE
ncbi:TBC1 domain family member 15-like isoform X2 [Lytechinus variegatus]|uniref:TBC1 domain family member 15-like isoform X2 n=1 Tax=Lytechinus variegatus TaxID=7654 RepID=UPI001BB29EB1|nr:TBC1 domain family member 15-like isoform X2 [Lytechinus variegatus]